MRLRGQNITLKQKNQHLISGADFFFIENHSYCIIGKNGCGKSSFLKLLRGYLPPAEGSYLVDDIEVSTPTGIPLNLFSQMAYLSQNPRLSLFGATPFEDLRLLAENCGMTPAVAYPLIDSVLEMCSLSDKQHHLSETLSGGELQKLALGAVITIRQPEVLLLDEATSRLDMRSRIQFLEKLFHWQSEKKSCLIYVTHIPDEMLLADSVYQIDAKCLQKIDEISDCFFDFSSDHRSASSSCIPNTSHAFQTSKNHIRFATMIHTIKKQGNLLPKLFSLWQRGQN